MAKKEFDRASVILDHSLLKYSGAIGSVISVGVLFLAQEIIGLQKLPYETATISCTLAVGFVLGAAVYLKAVEGKKHQGERQENRPSP